MEAVARSRGELPIPDFYDPSNAARWSYAPDAQALLERATAWAREHGIPPAAADRVVLHLLLIDLQRDFCFPEGALFVAGRSGRGAVEDNDRIARFIYRNLGAITQITCTLDSHYPFQIFSPAFWLDEEGRPPAPHREVTAEDVRAGRLRPNPALARWLADGDEAWLRRYVEYYCEELERTGKYRLYLWPPHCLVGGEGHLLAGVIQEARLFHAYARLSPPAIELKGSHPLTENYSALGPEVMTAHDGRRLADWNRALVERLMAADAVLVAGQAASHCVRMTLEDLIRHIEPAQVRKLYILRDCMSAVTVPDPARPGEFLVDFTPQAEEALARFEEAGAHVVESTQPLESWPELPRAGR